MAEGLIRYQHLGLTEKLDLITQHAALFVCGAGQRPDAVLVMRLALELQAEHQAAQAAEVLMAQSENPAAPPRENADLFNALQAPVEEGAELRDSPKPYGYDEVVERLGAMTDEVRRLRNAKQREEDQRRELQDTIVQKNREIQRLQAALQHPVVEDTHHRDLDRLVRSAPSRR